MEVEVKGKMGQKYLDGIIFALAVSFHQNLLYYVYLLLLYYI